MADTLRITTRSPQETCELGKCLSGFLFPSLVIALSGDLGAGKTVFTRGVVEGLGFKHVRSPSFTLINEYPTVPPVAHVDLYRLGNGEGDELGLEEYIEKGHLLIIEWGECLPDKPGTNVLTVHVSYGEPELLSMEMPTAPDDLVREITISARGDRATEALKRFQTHCTGKTGRGKD